jgi:hypothetical protein
MLSLWGDAIVALLLVATIGYSVLLNRRLTSVRSDRDKFEVLVRNLSGASERAEAAVANLRSTADELSRRLDKKVGEARALSDDLVYMIERGAGIADKLASQIRSSRDELRPDFRPEPRPESRPGPRPEPRNEHSIERVARAATVPASSTADPRSQSPKARPLPAFIRAAAPAEPLRAEPRVLAEAAELEAPVERPGATSRAERDLLRALAARRR